MRHSLKSSIPLAVLCAVLLSSLIFSATRSTHAAQATPKPLPPTWTPEPTLTPFPTLAAPTFDVSIPSTTPIPTFRPVALENAQLSAPLFFLSKRHTSTVYLARTDPPGTEAVNLTNNTTANVLSFDIARDGRVAYSTDVGVLMAAGRAKAWRPTLKTTEPLRILNVAWSPDGLNLAFTLRASDKDFAQMTKSPASGVYLWSAKGDPKQIIVDRGAAQNVTLFSAATWSPDGRNLLVRFDEQANGQNGYGWYVYNLEKRTNNLLIRFAPGNPEQYQDAIWTPDSTRILLFNRRSSSPDEPGGAVMLDLTAKALPLALLGEAPQVSSVYRFLPDGRLLVLGSTSRTEPLQLYVGTLNGLQATLKPIGKAFKLAWPGVLLISATGFPAYVLDQQYGVIVFNSGGTLAYDPAQLGINATDGPVYNENALPAWRFGPAAITMPTP